MQIVYVLHTEGAFILNRHSKMPKIMTSIVIIWHANEALLSEQCVDFVHQNDFSSTALAYGAFLTVRTFAIVPVVIPFPLSFFQAQKAEAAADAKWKAKQLFNPSMYLVTVQFEITIFYQVLY